MNTTPKHSKKPLLILLAALGFLFVGTFVTGIYRAARMTPAERHANEVKRLFAPDGSLPALKSYVKERMGDPASFEHFRTEYFEKDGRLYVRMKYRGKNAFNATRTEEISVEADYSGAVLRVVENAG